MIGAFDTDSKAADTLSIEQQQIGKGKGLRDGDAQHRAGRAIDFIHAFYAAGLA